MRKVVFPDVSFNLRTEEGLQPVSVGEQLHLIAAAPSKPGEAFTIDQIRARLPLVDKLSALTGERELLLEETEYTELLAAVKQSTWSGVSAAAIALVDAIEAAEVVDVAEKED
jgi:hypothetical protein